MSNTNRIAKIKTKDGQITILEIANEGTTHETETTHKIYKDPHPDFVTAFSDLIPHVYTILEWPAHYAQDRVRVTGVSFSKSENTGVEGCVLTGTVVLEECDAPFCFNTPHMPFEQYNEDGMAKLFPEDAKDAVDLLREEAEKLLKGKTSQGDLFEDQVVKDVVTAVEEIHAEFFGGH